MNTSASLVLAAAILFGVVGSSYGRVFRNQEGREIDAEIRSVRGGRVEMEMGGRLFAVPLESLSDEDQKFVREWAQANRSVSLVLRTSAVEDAAKRHTQGTAKDRTVTRQWRYETTITNRSGEDLKDLEIKYNIVVRHTGTSDETLSGKRSEERAEIVAGSHRIPEIANTGSTAFPSQWLPMKSRKWEVNKTRFFFRPDGTNDSEEYWDDYSNETQLDGIWVKVFENGRQISEWKSDGKLIKAVEWSDQSKPAQTVGLPGGDSRPVPGGDLAFQVHPDLPPVPAVPASMKGNAVVLDLVRAMTTKNLLYTSRLQRDAKKSDLRKLKADFEALLAKYQELIGAPRPAQP